MWLITIVLFADAWLAGTYGYFLAIAALVMCALIASTPTFRIAAVMGAAILGVSITFLEMSGVVSFVMASLVEFSLCTLWYLYRSVRGPTESKRLG
jgi:membrane protein implicated in regulation of membrane protease activity